MAGGRPWNDGRFEEKPEVCRPALVRRQSMRPTFGCGVLVLVIVIVASIARSAAAEQFGSLRLCPAGGRSFLMAWNLACEMKRKKRSVPDVNDVVLGTTAATSPPGAFTYTNVASSDSDSPSSNRLDDDKKKKQKKKRTAPEGYRPATLSEIMRICCDVGCEVRDLLAYCDPFGPWNS